MENKETKYSIKLYNIKTKITTVHELITIEGKSSTGNIAWNIQFDFFGKKLVAKNEFMLSGAINRIREIIEPKSYRMLIKWSERDAVQSGLLGDWSSGSLTYKLDLIREMNEKSSNNGDKVITFHVLEESNHNDVISIEEQKEFQRQYYKIHYGIDRKDLNTKKSSFYSWVIKIFKKINL